MTYNRHIPGPLLEQPFTVTAGIVVVYGVESGISVRIPAGGTWPGHADLPAAIADHLELHTTGCTPGSAWTDTVTPDALAAGVALITAQALMLRRLAARMNLLEQLGHPPRTLNQALGGGLVGSVRESFTKFSRTY
ncbi:hypothetical protein GCM10008959_25560 [Deinococcus seoulensis]|uniref:Uncharacterized protein n=1 Tax=Deinococcus seoulensis TaxID=1837379 RepID=A0ABQ2RW01_9DEIO|nr:hypothetical protein [Deinococcus seoulensis]GGR62459.1 hypothetical protein GCM10008959_25560 [Deinococcus seoulensis]